MVEIFIPEPRTPTEEELAESSEQWWSFGGPTFYDQWPAELRALSAPTKMVRFSAEAIREACAFIYSHPRPRPEEPSSLRELCAEMDAAMDWHHHFIKLNSRSPKDATYPELPITVAGRQAIEWLFCSERTFDDLCRFAHLPPERGAFVLLRENAHYWKQSEIRAFIKDGRLIGGTVYHYNDDEVMAAWKAGRHTDYESTALTYVREKVMPACGLTTFVADVAMSGSQLQLIEINPYGGSDPCLFGNYAAVENWSGGIRTTPAALSTDRPHAGGEHG